MFSNDSPTLLIDLLHPHYNDTYTIIIQKITKNKVVRQYFHFFNDTFTHQIYLTNSNLTGELNYTLI